jgi:hypothetical protein
LQYESRQYIPAKILVIQSVAGEPEGKVKAAAVLKVSCSVCTVIEQRQLPGDFVQRRPIATV